MEDYYAVYKTSVGGPKSIYSQFLTCTTDVHPLMFNEYQLLLAAFLHIVNPTPTKLLEYVDVGVPYANTLWKVVLIPKSLLKWFVNPTHFINIREQCFASDNEYCNFINKLIMKDLNL